MHGAGGGHAAGPSHPSWKHGERSRSAVQARKAVNDLIRRERNLQKLLNLLKF